MKFILIINVAFVLAIHNVALGQSQNNNSQEAETIYLPNEVDEKLIFKERPLAKYTEKARRNCVNGKVLLKALLKSSGKIEDIEVVKGLPEGLSESAIEAARKIKFEPAKKGGRKVTVSAWLEYSFDFSQVLPCKDGKRTR